jgi:hypothetical protein
MFRARAGAIEDFVVERVRAALADGRLAADVTQAVKERLAGQRGPARGRVGRQPHQRRS